MDSFGLDKLIYRDSRYFAFPIYRGSYERASGGSRWTFSAGLQRNGCQLLITVSLLPLEPCIPEMPARADTRPITNE